MALQLPWAALLFTLVALGTNSQKISVCKPGYEKHYGRCYKFVTEQMNWRHATEYCAQDGAEIVAMETPAERDHVIALVKHKAGSFQWKYHYDHWDTFWIGAYRSHGYGRPEDRRTRQQFWFRNDARFDPISYTLPNPNTSVFPFEECFWMSAIGDIHDYLCSNDAPGVICEDAVKEITYPVP